MFVQKSKGMEPNPIRTRTDPLNGGTPCPCLRGLIWPKKDGASRHTLQNYPQKHREVNSVEFLIPVLYALVNINRKTDHTDCRSVPDADNM